MDQQRWALNAMDRAVKAMRRSSSEPELCQSCCDAITLDAAYPLAWIGFALHDENRSIEIVARSGQKIAYLDEVTITWGDEPTGGGLAGNAIRSGKAQVVGNADVDPMLEPWRGVLARAGFHAAIGVPIMIGSECLGVLTVYSGQFDAFDADSVGVLENLADVIAFGISLYRTTAAMLNERQRATSLSEEKLRTLRLLSVLTDGSNDAIFAKDTEGRYLLCNREMLRSAGKSIEDVIGKTDEEIYAPGYAAEISGRDRAAMLWETPTTFEEKLTTADGERDFLSTRGPIREPNGNLLGVFGIARDITERKYIEERWKFALEGAGDGVWDWNIRTGEATFSKRYKEMLGFFDGEIGTTVSEWVSRVHPEDLPCTTATLREHLDGNTASARVELRMLCKDGSWKWILVRGMVVSRDADTNPLRLVGTITDISERKQAELALTESLREMEKKELSKTRFLAAAGHDMRQPIAAANLFVEALKLTSLNQRQSELIERLGQSMGVFSNMLDRLLDISKFDAGLVRPQIATSDLEDLLIWLDQNFAETAFRKQLRFRLFYPTSRPLFVRTDMGLVQSVLMNLVSNAIKFTERGSILISARRRAGKVLVQVWDTGIGIAEPDLAHVFDEFYQVANQQRSRDAGLGLGLSICQRALSVLGSEVTCRSQPGRGSVFQFTLPLSEAPAFEPLPGGAAPREAADTTLFRGKRVVLVEDDALVADAMTRLLESMGAKVECFHRAEAALQHAGVEGADYHIVDYMLGGTHTGIEFLDLVRQKRGGPLSAVLMTGDTSNDFIRKAATLDWPVLHKPVDVFRLVSILGDQGRSEPRPAVNR